MLLKKESRFLYPTITICTIAVLTFILTHKISLKEYTDFMFHAADANAYWAGELKSSYPVVYIVFGLIKKISGMADIWAMTYTQTFFAILCAIATYLIVCFLIPELSEIIKCLITFYISFCGPLYIGSENYYVGTGSFNTWHNPTNTCVKFLSLLIFFFFPTCINAVIKQLKP